MKVLAKLYDLSDVEENPCPYMAGVATHLSNRMNIFPLEKGLKLQSSHSIVLKQSRGEMRVQGEKMKIIFHATKDCGHGYGTMSAWMSRSEINAEEKP